MCFVCNYVCVFNYLVNSLTVDHCSLPHRRVVDHRHSPADVTAGAFIGTLFAVAYSSRFVRWASKRALQLGKGDDADNQQQEFRANVV